MVSVFFYSYVLFNWIVQLSVSASILIVLVLTAKQLPPITVVEKSIKNGKQIGAKPRINSAYAGYDEHNTESSLNRLLNLSYITKNTPLNLDISFFLSLIWIIGAFVIGIYKLSIYIFFQNKIREKLAFCDTEVINILEKCKSQMKISRLLR